MLSSTSSRAVVLLISAVGAMPAPASPTLGSFPTSSPPLGLSVYPTDLPTNFPGYLDPLHPVPSHFAIFGFSYDQTIINQPFFSPQIPYENSPSSYITQPGLNIDPVYNTSINYGDYIFGINNESHIFNYASDLIWTYNPVGEYILTGIFAQTPGDFSPAGNDSHPICQVIPRTNALYCELDGHQQKFAYCSPDAEPGFGISYELNWAANVDKSRYPACSELVLFVIEVPKGYGDEDPAHGCAESSDCSDPAAYQNATSGHD